MAVQKITNGLLYVLAADTKPTTYAVNTIAYEVDTGDIYKYTSGGWKLFRSSSISAYRRRGTTNNRWYIGGMANANGLSTVSTTINTFYATPLAIEKKRTVQDIGINTSTLNASATSQRLGIYTDDGQCYPASLVAEAATTVSSATAVFASAAFTGGAVLEPGLYWLTLNTSSAGTPTLRGLTTVSCFPILGIDNSNATTTIGMGWSVTRTNAALPASYPASATIMTSTGGIPAIYVRFA